MTDLLVPTSGRAGRGEQVGLALGAGIFYRLRDMGPQEGEIYESGVLPWCAGLICALEGPGRQKLMELLLKI